MNFWRSRVRSPFLLGEQGARRRFSCLVFLMVIAVLQLQCQNQEDQRLPAVVPPKTEAPSVEPGATPSPSPPPPSSALKNAAAPGSASCCEIVANAELKGRLGRLVVKFPDGANPGSTRIDVFNPGEQKVLVGGFGGHTFDLLPGNYDIEISKKRLPGVAIQSAHDTRVKVGVLQVYAGGNTRIDVLDRDGQPTLAGGFGDQTIGLPIGTFQVRVAGKAEPITIEDNRVTEF